MTRQKLARLISYMTDSEKAELDLLLASPAGVIDWLPLPGPQVKAFYSVANMLLYGGAAGGGKTDLLLGAAYFNHYRSAIFRRAYTNLTAIMERAQEMYDPEGDKRWGSYNGFFRRWSFADRPGHLLEYGAADKIGQEKKFQGRAHDAKLFDEVTHFTRFQFDYFRGWNRTAIPGQLTQVIATCNPPQKPEERWINHYWAPWLDKRKFPKGTLPGELLYFISLEGELIQVDGSGKWEHRNGKWRSVSLDRAADADVEESKKFKAALSYTFIPSSLKDNAYLDDGQYEAVLESLPEPLRSQLLYGDFEAGTADGEWQLIPTSWIEEAAQRWNRVYGGKPPAGMAMTQMGVDVARGGQDATVLTPRYGPFFDTQIVRKGLQTKDGMQVAGLVLSHIKPKTVVVIDAIGVGASPLDMLRQRHPFVIGYIVSEGTEETALSGYLNFRNKRALLGWRFREALDPNQPGGCKIAIPPDAELMADLAAYQYSLGAGGIQLESKEDMKDTIGRSPDKGDSMLLAGLPTGPIDLDLAIAGVQTGYDGGRAEEHGVDSAANASDAPWNL
jgi:hypothetical protein